MENEQYVIVTMAQTSTGREMVHAYGPYETRARALTEVGKMRIDDHEMYPDGPPVRFSVCKILGDKKV